MDRVDDIVIGAGTSGHGFKFGPLWGDLLASLATGDAAAVDLSPFSCARPRLRLPNRVGDKPGTAPRGGYLPLKTPLNRR